MTLVKLEQMVTLGAGLWENYNKIDKYLNLFMLIVKYKWIQSLYANLCPKFMAKRRPSSYGVDLLVARVTRKAILGYA